MEFLVNGVSKSIERQVCAKGKSSHADMKKLATMGKLVCNVNSMAYLDYKYEAEQREIVATVRRKLDNQTQRVHQDFICELGLIETGGRNAVWALWWRLFVTYTPVAASLSFSMFMSASMSVLLFSLNVFGVLLAGALFFKASGNALSKHAPAECARDSELMKSWLTIATSWVLSKLVAKLTSWIVVYLQGRKFIEIDERLNVSIDVAKKKVLVRWRIIDTGIVVLAMALITFSVMFCIIFLANVTNEDANKWLAMAILCVVNDVLLVPAALAFTFAFVTHQVVFKKVFGDDIEFSPQPGRRLGAFWKKRPEVKLIQVVPAAQSDPALECHEPAEPEAVILPETRKAYTLETSVDSTTGCSKQFLVKGMMEKRLLPPGATWSISEDDGVFYVECLPCPGPIRCQAFFEVSVESSNMAAALEYVWLQSGTDWALNKSVSDALVGTPVTPDQLIQIVDKWGYSLRQFEESGKIMAISTSLG
jgi:hypothetical protein